MERHERIAKAIAASGKKKGEIATECGVANSAVTQWINGDSKSLKPENLYALARATGFCAEWLAIGEGPERLPTVPIHGHPDMTPISVWDDETPLDDDEVEVPFLREVELAAGNGRTAIQESAGFKLRFGKRSLRRQGVQPENAVCVTISGNSMEPVLRSGATVGVDRGKKDVVDGDLYAINHGGQLRVKQVYRLPGGGIRLRSFNRDDHPDEEYPVDVMQTHGIEIIGRVFWGAMFF